MNRKVFVISCFVAFLYITTSSFFNVVLAAQNAREQAIKAVFLYNFTNFIFWPDTAFNSEEQPFKLCTLGDATFNTILTVTLENQKAKNGKYLNAHLINVDKDKNYLQTIKSCHILYINVNMSNLNSIMTITDNYPVLTVSDMDDFIEEGGIIQFLKYDNKIKLKINPTMLKAVQLKADANLLKLAELKAIPKRTRQPLTD